MEPPHPDIAAKFAARGLAAEYAEYERLLSARFDVDPSRVDRPGLLSDSQRRLDELGSLLTAEAAPRIKRSRDG